MDFAPSYPSCLVPYGAIWDQQTQNKKRGEETQLPIALAIAIIYSCSQYKLLGAVAIDQAYDI